MSQATITGGEKQTSASASSVYHSRFEPFIPKSIVCLREGYGRQFFLQDLFAGITVGLIAMPLALAFAIGSHVPPAAGLITAIIAGFLISALGGSRVAVGGPTGAFVVIIAGVVDKYGFDGLAIATLMAGIILIAMGVMRLGAMIKFIPYPVTTGFTAGIAVIIFSQQMKDFFGLQIEGKMPSEFVHQWHAYWEALRATGINYAALGISLGGLLVMNLFRKFAPRIPGAIVAVVLATIVVASLHLDDPASNFHVETIGTKFGTPACPSGIPQSLPHLTFPTLDGSFFTKAKELIPSAGTIALLAAIESLLCCVVADGMIGGRHKSNCELVGQGIANIGSMLFGGIPATGAIARTAANVKSGGRTPLAGMIHAVVLLLFMLVLAPYLGKIPLAVFASVLVMVAWNMSERDHFRHLFKAPKSDITVLLLTFGLTVFVDLTVAVSVGLVMASLLFMKRMSEVTNIGSVQDELAEGGSSEVLERGDPNSMLSRDVPRGVEVYEINGPFFFGAADILKDTLRQMEKPPKVFILRMRRVPAVDATGLHALDEFHSKCKRQGTTLLLSGVHSQPIFALVKYGLIEKIGEDNMYGNIDDALNRARQIIGLAPLPAPQGAQPEVARERK